MSDWEYHPMEKMVFANMLFYRDIPLMADFENHRYVYYCDERRFPVTPTPLRKRIQNWNWMHPWNFLKSLEVVVNCRKCEKVELQDAVREYVRINKERWTREHAKLYGKILHQRQHCKKASYSTVSVANCWKINIHHFSCKYGNTLKIRLHPMQLLAWKFNCLFDEKKNMIEYTNQYNEIPSFFLIGPKWKLPHGRYRCKNTVCLLEPLNVNGESF
jgi:hypothetical protein